MGLRERLFGARAAVSPEPPAPAYRDDACPDCSSLDFTPGPPVVRARSNGADAQAKPSGAMLLCLGCGAPWYTSPQGLVRPHDGALPPNWLVVADRLKAREGPQPARVGPNGARDESKPKRRVPGPHEGFAVPPKVG